MRRTAVLILAILCMFSFLHLSVPGGAAAVSAESGTPEPRPAQADVQRLAGHWVRPDGGYRLELSNVKQDGSLKAAYFNPLPINVHQAKWGRRGDTLILFVELRDLNYPGSKYSLQYDPASDRLKGTYYQAVEKKTYTVEFVRSR